MKVRIQPLGPTEAIRQRLRLDGWELESNADSDLLACHPHVPTEMHARERLYRLGLLTSRNVRIEFCLPSDARVTPPEGDECCAEAVHER